MSVETRTRGMGVAVTHQQTVGEASLLSAAHVSACVDSNALITIGYIPGTAVSASMSGQPSVNVGIVYTTIVTDDLEVWWCDGWKMLWNNKTKVLWPEESV